MEIYKKINKKQKKKTSLSLGILKGVIIRPNGNLVLLKRAWFWGKTFKVQPFQIGEQLENGPRFALIFFIF